MPAEIARSRYHRVSERLTHVRAINVSDVSDVSDVCGINNCLSQRNSIVVLHKQ